MIKPPRPVLSVSQAPNTIAGSIHKPYSMTLRPIAAWLSPSSRSSNGAKKNMKPPRSTLAGIAANSTSRTKRGSAKAARTLRHKPMGFCSVTPPATKVRQTSSAVTSTSAIDNVRVMRKPTRSASTAPMAVPQTAPVITAAVNPPRLRATRPFGASCARCTCWCRSCWSLLVLTCGVVVEVNLLYKVLSTSNCLSGLTYCELCN